MDKPKLKSNDSEAIIEVTQTPFIIGRSLGCDYIIGNEVISRKHCAMEKRNNEWLIKDFSRNGIYVNGNIVTNEQLLKDNDIISLSPEGNDYTFSLYSTNIGNTDPSSSASHPVVNSIDGNIDPPSQNNVVDDVAQMLTCDAELEAVLTALSSSVPPSPMATSSKEPTEPSTEVSLPSTSAVRKSSTKDERASKKTKVMEKACEEAPSKNKTDLLEKCDNEVQNANAASTSTKDEAKSSQTTNVSKSQYNLEEMEDEMQCSICSEMFIKATTLNCSHTFCKYCIETWKQTKNICPICRTKITTLNATIVLDNVIEKVLQVGPEEVKEHRKTVIAERLKIEEEKVSTSNNGRGRGANRGRRGNRGNRGNNHGNRGVPNNQDRPRIVIGPFPNLRMASSEQVISVDTSESESSSLSSTTGSDTDNTESYEWREDEIDNWEPGIPGAYYGGYGHCYSCGRRGHWANGCPFS